MIEVKLIDFRGRVSQINCENLEKFIEYILTAYTGTVCAENINFLYNEYKKVFNDIYALEEAIQHKIIINGKRNLKMWKDKTI